MTASTRPAVFLDRDGVLNDVEMREGAAASPRAVSELRVAVGAHELVDSLRKAGYLLVAVTNQPDIARGLVSADVVAEMNEVLRATLDIDAFVICPHQTEDRCSCRKPAAGMITNAAAAFHVHLERSWIVGDRWVDIAAGVAAGVQTILLERPYSWQATSSGGPPDDLVPSFRANDLAECTSIILGSPVP